MSSNFPFGNDNNMNKSYPTYMPHVPVYTPTTNVSPNIPPPPTTPVGTNTYQSANPIADFFYAPSHTTPWPHNKGLNFKK